MARQFPGTRLSLTLEAKSLQYKSHALTLKNCVLPSFLCYRANKGVLRRKQAMCWFRQRSENFSLPPFLGTKSRLLTCRARQPRSKIVTSLLVVVVRLKWTDYGFIIWGSERSRPTNLLILCVCKFLFSKCDIAWLRNFMDYNSIIWVSTSTTSICSLLNIMIVNFRILSVFHYAAHCAKICNSLDIYLDMAVPIKIKWSLTLFPAFQLPQVAM